MLLFKYVGPESAEKVLQCASKLSIRFGLPKSYNDPYELFLEPDQPLESEDERAFYSHFLGSVAEAPVACFSKRPDSVVMWAHYGREGAGICLAFDEDALLDQFPYAFVGDIAYSEGPAKISADLIKFAYTTAKRRHTLRLLEIGHRAAYFIKRTDWQYEAERRIVVTPDAVENRSGILLGNVDPAALRYIILGPKAGPEVEKLCRDRAKSWGVPLIQLRIGARTYAPFFTGPDMPAGVWFGSGFDKAAAVCKDCGEPASLTESGKCQWCDIDEGVKEDASRHSLLSLTLANGIDKGIPLAFDGLVPRGSLTIAWKGPLHYKSGEEIRVGDRVFSHGKPAEVEAVSRNPYDPNPEVAFHVSRYGPGVVISASAVPRCTFIREEQLVEDTALVFVSRATKQV